MAETRPGVASGPGRGRPATFQPEPHAGWRWFGWLGMALALAGGTDLILGWWPLELGSREWRFATIHQTISGSPLLVLGVGMALSAALALGTRWAVIFFGGAMVALGFLVSVGLIAFAMDVPLALEVATGPAAIGIRRVIWKTLAMGMVLGCFLLVGGSLALWRLRTFR